MQQDDNISINMAGKNQDGKSYAELSIKSVHDNAQLNSLSDMADRKQNSNTAGSLPGKDNETNGGLPSNGKETGGGLPGSGKETNGALPGKENLAGMQASGGQIGSIGNMPKIQSLDDLNSPEKMLEIKKEIAAKALQGVGLPEFASKAIMNNKYVNNKLLGIEKLQHGDLSGLKKLSSKEKSDKAGKAETAEEKDERENEEQKLSGDINFKIPLKKLKWVSIASLIILFFLLIVVFIATILTDKSVEKEIIAELSPSEIKELKNAADEFGTSGIDDNDEIPQEYYDRISDLGNLYSSQPTCSGTECYDRAEFLYYLKVADLSHRYQKKYNVKLDLYLLSTTDLYYTDTTEVAMENNLGGYDADKVDNLNIASGLDWDNDYTKISGYQYLDADDATYDLQILAKNMVRKKTVQTCTNSSGNIVRSQEDLDVEDKYLTSDKKLLCSSGENYNIKSTYTIDKDKYDEFLLEYIDKKMYTKGSGKQKNNRNYDEGCVSTVDGFIWPIGSMDVTTSNGVEYALGDPYTVTITSYFGEYNGFRITGHGAIDISGVPGVGVVPVIASKPGTVVYPTNSSQIGFADNGYYGNKDGGGYGNYVMIDHGDGTYTIYAHLAQNSITVMAGDTVEQGQVIGKLGHSGSSTGPHLHFEVRDGGSSSTFRVDPLNYVDPNNPRNGATSGSCQDTSMADAFVKLAVSQINDPDAVNGKKYWQWFGRNTRFEWCAAFVSWCVANLDYNGKTFDGIINLKGAAVSQWINYFYKQDNLEFIENNNCSRLSNNLEKYKPKTGDIIFFDWDNNWDSVLPTPGYRADHVGIVQRVEGNKIITIEGNSSNSVAERSYNIDSCQVIGFGSWY